MAAIGLFASVKEAVALICASLSVDSCPLWARAEDHWQPIAINQSCRHFEKRFHSIEAGLECFHAGGE